MRLQSCQIDGWFTDGFAIFIRSESLKPILNLLCQEQVTKSMILRFFSKEMQIWMSFAKTSCHGQVVLDQTQTPEIWELWYHYLLLNANLIPPDDRGIPKQIQLGYLIQQHPHFSQINVIWKFDLIASSLFSAKWQMVNEYKHEWIDKPNET